VVQLSRAANRAKAKWNAAHYKQLKFSVSQEISAAFKAACENAGVSMAGEVSQFMAEYSAVTIARKTESVGALSTRRKRRRVVAEMALQMECVLEAEIRSHERVPENLRGLSAYEDDGERISSMEEAAELLRTIY